VAQATLPYVWRPPFEFPVCYEWKEDQPLPEGVTILKADPGKTASLKICMTDKHKFTIEKVNIAEIHVDVRGCLKALLTVVPGILPEKVCEEAIRHVKAVCDRIDIEVISDVKTQRFCFILPTEWRFRGILKNELEIPFDVTDTNKVCFTVAHESSTVITILLTSDMTQTTQMTYNLITPIIVIFMVMIIMRMLKHALRRI